MVRRPALAAALAGAAVLLGAGCGGGGDERAELDAYLARADAAQQRHESELRTVDEAFRSFSAGRRDAGTLRRLARAAATFDATRAAVERLDPPAPAAALQRDLLLLYTREAALAGQVSALSRYLPAAERALRGLRSANASLRAAATSTSSVAREEAALTAYSRSLAGVASRLATLRPPRVLAPWHAEQAVWLRTLAADAKRLAGALRARTARVDADAAAFRAEVAREPGITVAQRRAVRAYDARVDAIHSLAARIQREWQRLDRTAR